MDAPLYPPAQVFVRPQIVPHLLGSADTPVAVLRQNPAAWSIVLKFLPALPPRISSGAIKPHLTNFSLATLVQYGIIQADQLPAIDSALAALGPVK